MHFRTWVNFKIASSKNAFQNMRLNYSVSELDSSFAINSVSNSGSDSDSESNFSSVFMNLDICICTLLNKPVDDISFPFS